MVSRAAEIVGAAIIVMIGFMAVGAIAYDYTSRSRVEAGPVHHRASGVVSDALEDGYTAQLALAQFPLPVAEGEQEREQLVLSLQVELAARGFEAGPADGVLHPETRGAIRSYQSSAGLDVTGEPTTNLLGHMMATRAVGDAAVPREIGGKSGLGLEGGGKGAGLRF